MKKAIGYITQRLSRLLAGMLLLSNVLTAYGQFQTTIGFHDPTNERSPGGILTPSGDYLILGDNDHHPNGLNGLPDGDMQLIRLDNSGNIVQPSKMLGSAPFDEAAWIERAPFGGADHYIIAGSAKKFMLLALTDPAGTPIWTRTIGTLTDVWESACVKMDANGDFILVGTKHDLAAGKNALVFVKVDNNGNQLWSKVWSYTTSLSLTASSVTAFASALAGPGSYYVTGTVSPTGTGNEEVFVLQLDQLSGNILFLKRYDVAPNSDDVGTCIQGRFSPAGGGNLWVSGYSADINAAKNVLMMRLDLNGNVQWARNYDLPGGDEFANHFDFAVGGKLVLTGRAEEYNLIQGVKAGNCLLMRMDAASGNTIDWSHVYTNNGFSSRGNRVEATANDEYFVTGEALEFISPSQSSYNILAIKTDLEGQTSPNCYHDVTSLSIPRIPFLPSFNPADISFGMPPDVDLTTLAEFSYDDRQDFCSSPQQWDCDFTWTTGDCFNVTFFANCLNPVPGNYTYAWDIYCDNNPELVVSLPASSHTFPFTFPCGGGIFQVCLTVTNPNGTVCNIVHTVVVPNTCCGSASGQLECHPKIPYTYNFTINVTDPPGSTGCTHVLTSTYLLSNLNYSGNAITGSVQVTDPVPLSLGFTLQTNCTCIITGLPMTCTLPFSLATDCCKKICVDDQIVCEEAGNFIVPVYDCDWPPVNNIYQVSWYVQPKPPSGICPTVPWGGMPYQSNAVSGTLTPLQLFPNELPGDVCVYAVATLNDGPCTEITSNIAMVQLCKPNSCSLNGYEYCYTGNPITPGLITLTGTSVPPTCLGSVEWFDPAGNSVQIGGSTYQPTAGLSMADDQHCYEDFYYTVVITDVCGQHECKSKIRLYSGNAPIGTLTMVPSESLPVCRNEDVTLHFNPLCVGLPPSWSWYQRDCFGNESPIPGAGTMNNSINLNELTLSTWFGVEAINGVCPPNREEILIEVKEPAHLAGFNAVADACAEINVLLSASITPGVVNCSNAPYSCTYTYRWYKNGSLIGTTNGGLSSTFNYLNPNPSHTISGSYSVVIQEGCCPDNFIFGGPVFIPVACEPTVMGPCFVCDNIPVTLMAQMVLPPNLQCPTAGDCTFTWYDAILVSGNWVMNNLIGTGATLSVNTGGHYFLQSDCNGCIKKIQFDLLGCTSVQNFGQSSCGVISVEELMSKDQSPLRIYPNPTTGEFTIEWSRNAPKNARILIADPMGRSVRTLKMPEAGNSLNTTIEDLPSGLYFVKVQSAERLFTVAKLVKE